MKTVLIIDDNAQYRQLMGEILRANGWQVLEAGDGESGTELARRQRPQIILCDLLMPRGNGFQVCRELRANPALRHIVGRRNPTVITADLAAATIQKLSRHAHGFAETPASANRSEPSVTRPVDL